MAKFINNRNWMLKVFPRSGGGTPLRNSDLKKPSTGIPVVKLWTPDLIPATSLLPVYNLTIQNARLTNALGTPTEPGSIDATYRANGPRGLPAIDIGQDGASIAIPGPDVAPSYYILADFDGYTQAEGPTANGVSGKPADYAFLWDGKYNRADQNGRPFFFLKHNGYNGYPFIQAGIDTSALTSFAFPTESAIALVLHYGSDGTGWMDVNGERSATKSGIGSVGIRGGFVIGSPGTEGATTPRIQIREFRVLLDNYPNALADAQRWQAYVAWKNGTQRQLRPDHPGRFGPPLADGSYRAPLAKPGLKRRKSVYVGYASAQSVAAVQTWATAMGIARPIMANDHGDFTSWSNMVNSGKNAADVWSAAGFTGMTMTLPLTVSGVPLAQAAAGVGDTYHTDLINYNKSKYPNGPRLYRLGHEFNVYDPNSNPRKFPWTPVFENGSVADFFAAWAHVSSLIMQLDKDAIIALNPATGKQAIDWTTLIPPTNQWHMLLIDGYNEAKADDYNNQIGWTRFIANVLNPYRLGAEQMILTAERYGKPWGFAEYNSGCGGTGSNANYPQKQGGDSPDYALFIASITRGGTGPILGYAEQPCTDDAPYEITDEYYSSRTYLSSPPQTTVPADIRDQKPNSAAAFKLALMDNQSGGSLV
jgi:hypothetical protein